MCLRQYLYLASIPIIICSCGNCEEAEKQFRQKSWRFAIHSKERQQGKFVVLQGTNQYGKEEIFQEVGFSDVLNNANIGDSLVKDSGAASFALIRGKQQMIFSGECGAPYEKPAWSPVQTNQ